MNLLPYQHEGVQFLAARRRAFLCDGMRLGKTPQSVRAADELMALRILVHCPAIAREMWAAKLREWQTVFDRPLQVIDSADAKFDPRVSVIINFDRADQYREALSAQQFAVGIVDETHFLKSITAKRTRAVYGMGGTLSRCDVIWALSGTVAPNNVSELFPQIAAVIGKRRMKLAGIPTNLDDFVNAYCTYYTNAQGRRVITGNTRRVEELRDFMRPYMLRRTLKSKSVKAQIAAAEPQIDIYPLPGDHKVASGQFVGMTADDILNIDFDDNATSTYRRACGAAKAPGAIEALKVDLAIEPTQKHVVFAYHREVIDALYQGLRSYGAVVVHGALSNKQKQSAIDAFNTVANTRLLIGQVQTCGTAIDLPCNFVDFVELSWRPDENDQALMRVVNVLKGDPVRARFFTLAGSIDQGITAVLARKIRALNQFYGDKAS